MTGCELTFNESPIQFLPKVLLHKILCSLDERDRLIFERVCKYWRDVSRIMGWPEHDTLSVGIHWRKPNNVHETIMRAIRAGPYLRIMGLCSKCRITLPANFPQFLTSHVNLYKFVLSSCNRGCDDFLRTIKTQSKSNILSMIDAVNALSKRTLKVLILDLHVGVPLRVKLWKFSVLRVICLARVRIDKDVGQGFRHLKSLQRLRVKYCDVHETFLESLSFLPILEWLNLTIRTISDEHVSAICKNCQQLKSLRITTASQRFRGDCLKDIAALSLKNVEITKFRFNSDFALQLFDLKKSIDNNHHTRLPEFKLELSYYTRCPTDWESLFRKMTAKFLHKGGRACYDGLYSNIAGEEYIQLFFADDKKRWALPGWSSRICGRYCVWH